jgi:hypothetical protein
LSHFEVSSSLRLDCRLQCPSKISGVEQPVPVCWLQSCSLLCGSSLSPTDTAAMPAIDQEPVIAPACVISGDVKCNQGPGEGTPQLARLFRFDTVSINDIQRCWQCYGFEAPQSRS